MILGKTVERYEDNITELKANIAKQENKLNQQNANPNIGAEVDKEIESDKEEFSKGVATKGLLKSIDEILQSWLRWMKETMANQIGKLNRILTQNLKR